MSRNKRVTFLYQEHDDNKINMIQSLAFVWHEDEVKTPAFDEEFEWARVLVRHKKSGRFRGDLLFNRPSLVGAITVANSKGDIVWVEDAGPHPTTTATRRDKMIARSYEGEDSA